MKMEKKLLVVNTKLDHDELLNKVERECNGLEVIESISYPFEGDIDSFRLFLYEEVTSYLNDNVESISNSGEAEALTESITQDAYKEMSSLINRLIQEKDYKDLSLDIKNRRIFLPTALEIEPVLLKFICAKKSINTSEAYVEIANFFKISEEEKNIRVRSGKEPQWQNNVRWARRFLKEKGYLKTNSEKGIWEISDKDKKIG